MWIYTKAVLCDGQESLQGYLGRRLLTIMESVIWVCDETMEGHEWVSELTVSMQENEILVAPNYEIEVPCVVQWGLLWFSSPSRLNQRFAENGRPCMLRSVAAFLDRAPDKDWTWAGN